MQKVKEAHFVRLCDIRTFLTFVVAVLLVICSLFAVRGIVNARVEAHEATNWVHEESGNSLSNEIAPESGDKSPSGLRLRKASNEAIYISPRRQACSPGQVVTYTVVVTNTTGVTDTIELAVSDTASLNFVIPSVITPASFISATPGVANVATLSVTVASDAIAFFTNTTTVTATFGLTITQYADSVQTEVAQTYGVDLSIDPASGWVPSNSPMTYTVTVTNTGNYIDTINLESNDSREDFTSALETNTLSVAPFSGAITTTFSVTPTGCISVGIANTTVVTATAGDDIHRASAQVTTTVSTGSLDHFSLSNIVTQTAGISFTIAITAQDHCGNTVIDHADSVILTDTTGTISPTIASGFVHGVLTASVIITKAQTGIVITVRDATDPTKLEAGNPFAVVANVLDHFTIGEILGPKLVGELFDLTISARDTYYNIAANYEISNTLSDSTGTIYPTSTGNFTDGDWEGKVSVHKAQEAVIITTIGDGKVGTSNSFAVKPIVLNGDFEDGWNFWEYGGEVTPTISAEDWHSPGHSALLGVDQNIDQPTGRRWLTQTIQIAPYTDKAVPILSFYYHLVSYDRIDYDWFDVDVHVIDSNGITRTQVLRAGRPPDVGKTDFGWQYYSFDLADCAPSTEQTTLKLKFSLITSQDEHFNTWVYVDDVAIIVPIREHFLYLPVVVKNYEQP